MRKVDMCFWYYWDHGAKCAKGLDMKASVKCHTERTSCPDYKCSWSTMK